MHFRQHARYKGGANADKPPVSMSWDCTLTVKEKKSLNHALDKSSSEVQVVSRFLFYEQVDSTTWTKYSQRIFGAISDACPQMREQQQIFVQIHGLAGTAFDSD